MFDDRSWGHSGMLVHWALDLENQAGALAVIIAFFLGLESTYDGLMVSVPIPKASSLGLSPGWGQRVVFLGKTLSSRSASLHPGV